MRVTWGTLMSGILISSGPSRATVFEAQIVEGVSAIKGALHCSSKLFFEVGELKSVPGAEAQSWKVFAVVEQRNRGVTCLATEQDFLGEQSFKIIAHPVVSMPHGQTQISQSQRSLIPLAFVQTEGSVWIEPGSAPHLLRINDPMVVAK